MCTGEEAAGHPRAGKVAGCQLCARARGLDKLGSLEQLELVVDMFTTVFLRLGMMSSESDWDGETVKELMEARISGENHEMRMGRGYGRGRCAHHSEAPTSRKGVGRWKEPELFI